MSDYNTNETHDRLLRARAVPIAKKKKKKKITKFEEGENPTADEPRWPETILAFDTESRVTVDQSLTIGVWRRCKLVAGVYEVVEEGIFYSDDLPAKDLKLLKAYMETAISDARSFPPRFPLYSRSKFMEKVFWPALKREEAMVVGFNLGYDLTRLALDWKVGNKRDRSLIIELYADRHQNCNCPRILDNPIDSH